MFTRTDKIVIVALVLFSLAAYPIIKLRAAGDGVFLEIKTMGESYAVVEMDEPKTVTVIADTTAVANALATAYFVLGPKESLRAAEKTEGIDVLIVDSAGNLTYSEGLSAILTLVK